MLAVALVAYWVLVGGTEAGHVLAALRALNAAFGGVLIWLWLRRLPHDRDRIDNVVLVGLGAFLVTASLTQFPRSSLDAAVSAMAWVAALYHARRLARRDEFRKFTLTILGIAGASLALFVAVIWGAVWMRWLELVDFGSAPPLTTSMPVWVFRHVHVIAFTLVLLQPAVLSLWRSSLLRPLVVLSLGATTFVAFASGSRTAWGAAILASVLVLFVRLLNGRGMPSRRVLAIAAVAVAGATVSGWAAGLGQPFVERLTNLQTLGARGEIWSAALDAFQQDPITGSGPGTFVTALPLSGYFTGNAFAPRHADNALIQLLSEGGILAGVGVLWTAIMIGAHLIRRSASRTALWAVAFFTLACITDNPTDTAGLNVLLLVWVALALPPTTPPGAGERLMPTWTVMRVVHAAAFAVVCSALAAVSLAHVIRDDAVRRVAGGDLGGAMNAMLLAVALDPGHPLYQRELGLLELVAGDTATAGPILRRASVLAPTDDVTWRSLAVAEAIAGNSGAAMSAAAAAKELRPSDLANLLLPVALALDLDPGTAANTGVLNALQLDPLLAASPTWDDQLGRIGDRQELLVLAYRGASTPEATKVKLTHHRMWLGAIAGEGPASQGDEEAARDSDSLITSRAWALLMDCRITQAYSTIRSAQPLEGDSSLYWFARAVIAAAEGSETLRARQLAVLVNPSYSAYTAGIETDGSVPDPEADRRRYGRLPMAIPLDYPKLPTSRGAAAAWWQDPFAAAGVGAPASELATCRR